MDEPESHEHRDDEKPSAPPNGSDADSVPAQTAARAGVPRWVRSTTIVVGTAVVGALATAIITEGRVDALWDWISSSGDDDVEDVDELKRVATASGSLSMEVPDSWGAIPGTYNIEYDGVVDPGDALFAGTEFQTTADWSADTAYLAASSVAPVRLELVGASATELEAFVLDQVRSLDWTREGCVLVEESGADRPQWVAAVRAWTDCAGIDDMRLWQYDAISADGTIVATMLVSLTPDSPQQVADTILMTWQVAPEKLPTDNGGRTAGDRAAP